MRLIGLVILLGILLGMTGLGMIWISVQTGEPRNVTQTLDEIRMDNLQQFVDQQSDIAEVTNLFDKMHREALYQLITLNWQPFTYSITGSFLFAFNILNTLGDNRVSVDQSVFYLTYTTIGTICYFAIVYALSRVFCRNFFKLFASSNFTDTLRAKTDFKKVGAANEENFLNLLKRRRHERNSGMAGNVFGGSKLEVFRDDSIIELRPIEPACGTMLFFILYTVIGGTIWHFILQLKPENLVISLFDNYFYIMSIDRPVWMNYRDLSIAQTAFLVANSLLGNIFVTATLASLGKAFFHYSHDIFQPERTKWQYESEYDYGVLVDKTESHGQPVRSSRPSDTLEFRVSFSEESFINYVALHNDNTAKGNHRKKI